MEKHFIMGVHITNRVKRAEEVQKLFTEYGCQIRTRLGLHVADDKICSPNGLILLEMAGDEAKCHELADRLSKMEGIEVQKMIFAHE